MNPLHALLTIMLLSFVPATPTTAPTAEHAVRRYLFAQRALRDRGIEAREAYSARCNRLAQENPEYRQADRVARALNLQMTRLKRGTDEYRRVEQEWRAAVQQSAAISKPHLAADPEIVKTEQARAIAQQRADTLKRDAERLVMGDFKLATTEDARTAQLQGAFNEMVARLEELETAQRDSIARLTQASPEHREARAAVDAIKKAMKQAEPDGEPFRRLSEEYRVAWDKLTDIETEHLDADPAFEDVAVRSTFAELRFAVIERQVGRRKLKMP